LWAELLGIDRVGRHDNFFELGGHSLTAVRMVTRLHQVLGIDMPLGDVFAAPELAQLAERMRNAACALPEPIPSAERERPVALSLAQQRLWLLTQMDGAGQAYHIAGALRLRGALEPDLLHRALTRVVQRHAALRTCFRWVDEQPVQCVQPDGSLPLTTFDLRTEADPETAARRLRAHAAQPFDLAHELPIRVLLLRLQDQVYLLQLVMHHIASDGWSVGVLLKELSQLYTAYQQDRPDPLPPLPLQYADFSVWQRQRLDAGRLQQQSAFWRDQLQGAPAHLALPTDRPHPPVQDHAGDSLPVRVAPPLAARLAALGRRHGATLYATLLAGWAALLGRLGGQDEVVIGSPVAGRHRVEVEPLIGCFVNTLALRITLRGDPTVAQLLARTQAVVLAGQQHQELPFDQVVEALQPPRGRARTPLFQVMFAWQSTPAGQLQLPGVAIEPCEMPVATAQFELTLSLQESEDGIVGDLGFATALFDRDTVRRILARWITLLCGMADHEHQAIARLDILPAAEREQVLVRWNDKAQTYPRELCVHQR
ncbi:condensation domain-containing protein, partial [Sphingomonas sp. NCPPB 2930]